MMFKIEMDTINASLELEIKKNNDRYLLLAILSASPYLKTTGGGWQGEIADETTVRELAHLVKACKNNPSVPKGITILDGMPVKIRLTEDDSETELMLKDTFYETQNEYQLLKKILLLVAEVIPDVTFRKYMREFGGQGS